MELPSLGPVGNLPDVLIAAVGLAIGLAVLLARPRGSANAYFAAFMAFLAWGVLAGVAYIAATQQHLDLTDLAKTGADVAADLAAARARLVTLERAFWIPYIFDPVTLLYFASIYPRRNRLHRVVVLAPFALAALALLAIDVLAPIHVPAFVDQGAHVGPFGTPLLRLVVLAYVLGAYLLGLSGLVGQLDGAPGGIARKRAWLLVLALGVAVFARIGLTLEEMPLTGTIAVRFFGAQGGLLATRLLELATALAALALWRSWAVRRVAPGSRADLDALIRTTGKVILAFGLVVWLPLPIALMSVGFPTQSPFSVTSPTLAEFLSGLERMRFSGRWLIFGTLVGYSIVQYQLFDFSTRAKRLALQGLAAAALFGAFVLVVALSGDALAQALARDSAVLLVAAVLASVTLLVAFDAARKALARRVRDPDADEVRLRKLEVYRAALEANEDDADRLRALRQELGITDEGGAAVELLVRAPRHGPLAPAAIVAGRYRVDRLLGRGGGGRAFLAHDLLLDRAVVLKEALHWDHDALAEARLAGSLSHPSIVVVYDIVHWGTGSLIVMEYVAGGSLAARLRDRGPLPPHDATKLLRGVLAGLAAVHARGIVHGDVTPANVLLTVDDAPKLTDFGIALATRAATATRATQEAAPPGFTLRYAAPEVAGGQRATPASDVYSAGAVLLDAVAGRDGQAPDALPEGVSRAVARATAPRPEDRFDDAGAFLAALDALG